jgi:hypothetical protein
MPYNQNIPVSTDKLSSSQVDINNNFTAIKTFVDVDHVDFSDGVKQGMHQKITFPISAAPAVSLAGYIGLYGKNDGSGNPQIYVNNVAPALQIPMTSANLATPGWTYLPSGIILQWGSATINNGTVVNFNMAFPNTCFSVQLTCLYNGHQNLPCVNTVSTTGFKGYGQRLTGGTFENTPVYYLAIGN